MRINADLARLDNVSHGFFTRQGGVSTGIYASLNCGLGSGDARAHVIENRSLAASQLGLRPGDLVTAYQVHGVAVAKVDIPWTPGNGPHADALVSCTPGIALGILTADCTPILLADGQAGVIGAAHAGWKGAKGRVAEAVVAAMIDLGAKRGNIVAAVGPAIGPASYEVGAVFQDAFLIDNHDAAPFFATPAGGQPHFDLPGYVECQLVTLGLGAVHRVVADTYAESEQFFSYRRACHRAETDYGRQLSAIALV